MKDINQKKKMLIVLFRYYPICDSVTAFIDNITVHFSKFYDITIVCPRSDLKSGKIELRNGISIRRVTTFWDWPIIIRGHLIGRLDQSKKSGSLFFPLLKLIISALFFPFRLLSKRLGVYYIDGYSRKFGSFIEDDIISSDVVLTTIMPYENAQTLFPILLKYPKIKWLIIQSDPYVDYSESEELIHKKVEYQNTWYERATLIVVQETILEIIYRASFRFRDKIIPLFIPTMREIITDDEISRYKRKRTLDLLNNTNKDSKQRISCVYTGLFYSRVREPFFLIDIFTKLHDLMPSIEVYILGEVHDNMVQENDWVNSGWLFFCGRQPQDVCDRAQHEADFLINVGNMIPNLVPSKVMQYISTRKPIINLYYLKKDVAEDYLSEYPIKEAIYYDDYINADNSSTEQVDELRRFIESNNHKYADYNFIVERYDKYSARNYVETIMRQDNMKYRD